jgi:serine protease AprX
MFAPVAPQALRRALIVLSFIGALLCASTPARAQSLNLLDRVDRPVQYLLGRLDIRTARVIVRTEPGAMGILVRTVQLLGGVVHAQHPFINGVTVTLPALQLPLLVRVPGVLSISLDAPVQGGVPVDAGVTSPSHLAATLGLGERTLLTPGIDGSGVGVAVIDSGLMATGTYNMRRFVDFTRPSRGRSYTEDAPPSDEYGHGTHVAGLIAGNGAGSNGRYRGVAPGATLIGLKALDGNGAGLTSHVLSALEYAIDNRRALGIRVVNLSLGHPIFERADRDPLVAAVEAAARKGLVVVVSAGNWGCLPNGGRCGYAGITSPGNAPSAITIGSIDTLQTTSRLDDVVASYSSRGPSWYDGFAKPDLVAPGHRLVSTTGSSSKLGRDTSRTAQAVTPWLNYTRLSGTSMATAVASGAAALVLDANERGHAGRARLTPNAVKAILEFTSFAVNGADELTQGAGALNAAGAIELARHIDPSAPAGAAWLDGHVTPSTRIGADVLPWSQRIIWGDRVAMGDILAANAPAWSQAIIWGDALVWGESLVWGDALVWGEAIVWGDTIIWADAIVWGDTAYNADTNTWANLANVP